VAQRPSTNGHTGTGGFRVSNEIIVAQTGVAPDFIDLTDQVTEVLSRSGVTSGQVLVFSRHTTAAIRVQEAEPLLIDDMRDCLERLAPRDLDYRHNDFRVRTVNMTPDESPNGHSHCRHLFLSSSETIPVVDGQLALGRWQRVFLIELDHPRRREVHVQVLGLA
jgi:secondary thiamine-phosphate synthase enzyme